LPGLLDKTCTIFCMDWNASPSGFLSWSRRLGPGLCIALLSEQVRHIATVDEDIDHEAIVDILAVRTLWKECFITPGLVIRQTFLFVNPAVPDLPGA
jgi:hypothetical protein